MKPADYRNATWREVLPHIQGDMIRVHDAWMRHGPGTTREVAQKSGISLFTFRPRTTDLYKLGLVELLPSEAKGEGVYEFRTYAQAEAAGVWRRRADCRRKASDEPETGRVGFVTVDEAVASLSPAERRALGARLMGEAAHGRHRTEPTSAQQLNLLPA